MLRRLLSFAPVALWMLGAGCSNEPAPPRANVITPELAAQSVVPDPSAQACAPCHPREVEAWASSQHAIANRLPDPQRDGRIPGRNAQPEAVIGISPLIQYLAPFPGGRLQAVDMAYDTRSNEWFYVFADERQPGDWGHWTGRAMTWNVQCASCHMTGFEKRYDATNDSYSSTWTAMGISCFQCHAPLRPAANDHCPVTSTVAFASSDHQPSIAKRSSYLDTCASCHARRETLTASFGPGERFNEHYRLTLPDQPGIYYADGQVREENFEHGSFVMSRMAHKGVTCLDCHDPHSYKLKQPAEGNALCLQCHRPPGQRGATPIDPATHSHHALTNAGSSCVECHMPITHYMVRDPRRDHGFTSPDPLLTKELGIPNACNRCHATNTVGWAIQWTDSWYGGKMENRRARQRARMVARAWDGDETAGTSLVAMARAEDIDAWRSALTALLAPWNGNALVRDYLMESLAHTNELVRSAAVRALAGAGGSYDALRAMRRDPSRLVRLDASLVTANPVEHDTSTLNEVRAYLHAICDQPAGALRNAEYALNQGRPEEAERWARRAASWDRSAIPQHSLGLILHRMGRLDDAIQSLAEASRRDTNDASFAYTLALVQAEAGRASDALRSLQETVRRDPSFGRAWYNLGLAYAARGNPDAALDALMKAEKLLPGSADPIYAAATILAQRNDIEAAKKACRRALAIDPTHEPTIRMMMQLRSGRD